MGVKDLDKKFKIDDLARGSVMFIATGVTDGSLLKGVRFLPDNKAKSYSLVMRSSTGPIRMMEAHHDLSRKPKAMNG
ncbi:Fructose-1,6-bisphosphatase class 2 [compost metagenome]